MQLTKARTLCPDEGRSLQDLGPCTLARIECELGPPEVDLGGPRCRTAALTACSPHTASSPCRVAPVPVRDFAGQARGACFAPHRLTRARAAQKTWGSVGESAQAVEAIEPGRVLATHPLPWLAGRARVAASPLLCGSGSLPLPRIAQCVEHAQCVRSTASPRCSRSPNTGTGMATPIREESHGHLGPGTGEGRQGLAEGPRVRGRQVNANEPDPGQGAGDAEQAPNPTKAAEDVD